MIAIPAFYAFKILTFLFSKGLAPLTSFIVLSPDSVAILRLEMNVLESLMGLVISQYAKFESCAEIEILLQLRTLPLVNQIVLLSQIVVLAMLLYFGENLYYLLDKLFFSFLFFTGIFPFLGNFGGVDLRWLYVKH